MLTLGSIVFSFYVAAILLPNKIGSGGVTGIAICITYLFKFKLGTLILIINIPLFLWGYNLLGKKFAIRSAYIVLTSSIFIDIIGSSMKFQSLNDMLLASIFAGVLCGISMAVIFMSGGSTGGLDILAKIIKSKFENVQLSNILLIQDILVYGLVSLVLGYKAVLYALVMSFIRSKTIDTMQEGISSSKQCIIICEKFELITEKIQNELSRGVTLLDAVGGYSNDEKKFIYVVIQKNELRQLKELVREVDSKAFVSVSNVNEILGNFKKPVSIN